MNAVQRECQTARVKLQAVLAVIERIERGERTLAPAELDDLCHFESYAGKVFKLRCEGILYEVNEEREERVSDATDEVGITEGLTDNQETEDLR